MSAHVHLRLYVTDTLGNLYAKQQCIPKILRPGKPPLPAETIQRVLDLTLAAAQ